MIFTLSISRIMQLSFHPGFYWYLACEAISPILLALFCLIGWYRHDRSRPSFFLHSQSICQGQLLQYPSNSMKLASIGNAIFVQLIVIAIFWDQHQKKMVFFLAVVAAVDYGVDYAVGEVFDHQDGFDWSAQQEGC